MRNLSKNNGFTLLELLAVLAIIAVLTLFALPAFQDWNAKKSFDKSMNDFYSTISQARLQSFVKNTTTKITTTKNSDDYNITIAFNATAVTNCAAAAGWTVLETSTISLHSNFEVTGSGIGDVCFFRDGTSTGATYNIAQKNGQTDLGNGTISVILTTGFIDAVKN